MRIRMLCLATVGCLTLIGVGCTNYTPQIDKSSQSAQPVETGDSLFKPASWPTPMSAPGLEPLAIPFCQLTVKDRQDICAVVEGEIEIIGVETKENLPPDRIYTRRDGKKIKRLQKDDWVDADQRVLWMNDEVPAAELKVAEVTFKTAQYVYDEASRYAEEVNKILDTERKALQREATARESYYNISSQYFRALAEASEKKAARDKADSDVLRAKAKLDQCYVNSRFRGKIVEVYKRSGEGVRASEAVLQIVGDPRLGVEGSADIYQARTIAENTDVIMEPIVPVGPSGLQPTSLIARKPITSVAVGEAGDKQWIIAASLDGHVRLWDRKNKGESSKIVTWKHPAPVKVVAVTRPKEAPPHALTGCEDGKARLYDLNKPNDPPKELDGNHEGGVNAAAFSPNGQNCVTSDDRGNIFLWDVATGKKIYDFPRRHTSSVASLSFTPQCKVYSVGHENIAYLWYVGAKGAAVEKTFEFRNDRLNQLDVTSEGSHLLLGHDKAELHIVNVQSGETVYVVRRMGEAARFDRFAYFSPQIGETGADRLILTGGENETELHLWRKCPNMLRVSELYRLKSEYGPMHCACFSQTAQDGVIVVGTDEGRVLVYPMPTKDEMSYTYKAHITGKGAMVEASGKLRITAEYQNIDDVKHHLQPGMSATLVIPRK